jgi:hypothetical protein
VQLQVTRGLEGFDPNREPKNELFLCSILAVGESQIEHCILFAPERRASQFSDVLRCVLHNLKRFVVTHSRVPGVIWKFEKNPIRLFGFAFVPREHQ